MKWSAAGCLPPKDALLSKPEVIRMLKRVKEHCKRT